MVDITLQGKLRDQLDSIHGVATFRDAQGRLLGYFVPASPYASELYSQAVATVDPQELARRAQDSAPGRTTQEVLERLKHME